MSITTTPQIICQTLLAGEEVCLHAYGGLYWQAAKTLIVADLHLGKATHFRRHGMAVPQYVQDETLEKLTALIVDFQPERVLILGDLFHADYNPEWEAFADLVLGFKEVRFELVLGNHDRLTRHQYEKYKLVVRQEPFFEGPFAFSHHPFDLSQLGSVPACPSNFTPYNLAGHVHPSARMVGRGESLKLPCFFFGRQAGLLPALGAFTGTHPVSPKRGDRAFLLAGNSVLMAPGLQG